MQTSTQWGHTARKVKQDLSSSFGASARFLPAPEEKSAAVGSRLGTIPSTVKEEQAGSHAGFKGNLTRKLGNFELP